MGWKDLVYNQPKEPAKPVQQSTKVPDAHPPVVAPIASTKVPSSSSFQSNPTSIYLKLKEVVSIWNTPSFKQISSFMTALEGIITDDGARFQAGCAQAEAQGLPRESITADLNSLMDILRAEKDKFEAAVTVKRQEISSKEAEIQGIDASIADLNRQISELSATRADKVKDISASKITLDSKEQQLTAACDTLSTEILTEVSKYQSLLPKKKMQV